MQESKNKKEDRGVKNIKEALIEALAAEKEIQNLLAYFNSDSSGNLSIDINGEKKLRLQISGIQEGADEALLSLLIKQKEKEAFFIVNNDVLAQRKMAKALAGYGVHPLYLPPREASYGKKNGTYYTHQFEHERIFILCELSRGKKFSIITSARSLTQFVVEPSYWLKKMYLFDYKKNIFPDEFEDVLQSLHYEKKERVEACGEYSRRGDIIDFWPVGFSLDKEENEKIEETPSDTYAIRLSFFDDEIDDIKYFSTVTQRSVAPLENKFALAEGKHSFFIYPAFEALPSEEEIEKNREENSIFAYLRQHIFYLSQAEKLLASISQMMAIYKLSLELPSFLPEFVFEFVLKHKRLIATSLFQLNKDFRSLEKCKLGFFEINNLSLQNLDKDLEKELLAYMEKKEDKQSKMKLFLAILDEKIRENLQDKIRQIVLFNQNLSSQNVEIEFLDTPIEKGFCIGNLALYGTKDIKGYYHKQVKYAGKKAKQNFDKLLFADLGPGDYVVHDQHGIARYKGLVTLERQGEKRDYLKLEYAKDDALFIPMEALSHVQKYVAAGSDREPKLSRLGTGEWQKLKDRARNSTRELATNLVKLYAKRMLKQGYAFVPDPGHEEEFASSFPFVETADQLRCIEEIKNDMTSQKCMDRLLCGDVGFGKTEIAFRAMFLAVCNGKQAVLVAPTTVLTHQHYENLCKRLEDFPIRVGELSRFVKAKKKTELLSDLKKGKIDILVATHRAFSADVEFKDLGLLVIDEEQRFGVDHKEAIKDKYPFVDVLSLSATPIPRTLHMGLAGIRDISLLQEPPIDRRAVMTYVFPFEMEIIENAIERELERNGQVFYLFNNTYRIDAKASYLLSKMPNLRIGIAHGKMTEQKIDKVIHEFLNGELDMLLCTTIIESGIDMPNVNTIIIENAECLGLSALYQLRGRVGRSNRQAYAYISYAANKVLKEKAAKRLASIRDFTELGAGFKIAMQDLELRGAGNLLGAEQHGQMEIVGYDLYCRMLAEEIELAKKENQAVAAGSEGSAGSESSAGLALAAGQKTLSKDDFTSKTKSKFSIDLGIDAYLPENYIRSQGERMDFYRSLAELDTEEKYFDYYDELSDRYGSIPDTVESILILSYIRARAIILGINKIDNQQGAFRLTFANQQDFNPELLAKLLQKPGVGQYIKISTAYNQPIAVIYQKEFKNHKERNRKLLQFFIDLERISYEEVSHI